MYKTALIFRHEFLETVKRTGFIILTLSLPVVALLAIGLFQLISGISRPPVEVTRIGYVDLVGNYNQFTNQGNITLVQFSTVEAATQALINKKINEFFVIPADYISTGQIDRYNTWKELVLPPATVSAIKNFLSGNLLAGKVPAATAARVESPVNLVTLTLANDGSIAADQGGFANFVIPGVFSLLLALSIIFSSTYLLQGLGEEKENRLIEILLSSVSNMQLVVGKVMGMGAAGLAQVIVWVITIPFLTYLASVSIGGFISTIQVPVYFLILGVVYFILGYLLFAVLSISVAAISSTVREGQAIASIFTLFAIAPFWFFSLILAFPNNPVWIVFSIFPLSAPVLTIIRLGMSSVPAWQLAISVTVMIFTIVGGLMLAAKLLRIYMLMYGKRPDMGEIVHNLLTG